MRAPAFARRNPGYKPLTYPLDLSGRPDYATPSRRAISSVVEHCLHTAGVAGSNPASPTSRRDPC